VDRLHHVEPMPAVPANVLVGWHGAPSLPTRPHPTEHRTATKRRRRPTGDVSARPLHSVSLEATGVRGRA
jgi:hypothetical protein